MSSAKRDKGAVYDHWQQFRMHYNPVWDNGTFTVGLLEHPCLLN